jgi:hypothetical protein
MLDRRTLLAATAAGLMGGLTSCSKERGQKMAEIKFDLGKNILETGRASGVPQFETDNINGYISYSVAPVPETVPARYTRPGYEVVWQPIFAFTMNADEGRFPDRRVQSVDLQLSSKINRTHEEARAFVEQTIAQFQKGRWQRYFNPVWDTLLTGRSSLLDERGEIASDQYNIDPAYKIPLEDWPIVVSKGPLWRWVGDGVLASLKVNDYGNSDRGVDYRMNLEFHLLDVKLKRDAENEARDLQQGDAKGWNSTARLEREKKERAELNKRLEANAIQRGDSVVTKP